MSIVQRTFAELVICERFRPSLSKISENEELSSLVVKVGEKYFKKTIEKSFQKAIEVGEKSEELLNSVEFLFG